MDCTDYKSKLFVKSQNKEFSLFLHWLAMKTPWSGEGKCEKNLNFLYFFSSNLVIKISTIISTKWMTLAPKDNSCFKGRQCSWQQWEDCQLALDGSRHKLSSLFFFFLSTKLHLSYNKSLWSNYGPKTNSDFDWFTQQV